MRDNGDHIACADVALLAVSTPIFMYKRSARDADGRNKRFRKTLSLIFFYKIMGNFLSLSITTLEQLRFDDLYHKNRLPARS